MSERTVSPRSLSNAISDILEEYGDSVVAATDEGLDEAENILIRNLKAASPKKTKRFAKGWKGTKRKYKLARYVGNTKLVHSKGRNIPLSNIFEYSTTNHAQPFIKQTFENSASEMARAIVDAVKKG